jgi:hypothetical protein
MHSCHDILLYYRPKAMEPTDYRLEPLKLFISFLIRYFITVTEANKHTHAQKLPSAHKRRQLINKCPSGLAFQWDNVQCILSMLSRASQPQF